MRSVQDSKRGDEGISFLSCFQILDVMSALLSVTLPLLGVMIASHPFSTLLTCAVQTYFIVEESVMKKWSPEAYILFFTFICLLFITRRSVVT